jgi:membrane protein DedA with SNARE-associated domain
MTVDALTPYLAFFVAHVYAIVFVAAMIDATGLPFPGRFLIITAGAVASDPLDAVAVLLLAAAGALIGDHGLYLLGRLGGERALSLYCRWTMGSARCVEKARSYFRRFGGVTVVIGRFVTGVRLFAATLAGSGGLSLPQFFLYDAIGALAWATIFVTLGHVVGSRAAHMLDGYGVVVLGIGALLVPAGMAYVAYRLRRRRRHGPAALASRAA